MRLEIPAVVVPNAEYLLLQSYYERPASVRASRSYRLAEECSSSKNAFMNTMTLKCYVVNQRCILLRFCHTEKDHLFLDAGHNSM